MSKQLHWAESHGKSIPGAALALGTILVASSLGAQTTSLQDSLAAIAPQAVLSSGFTPDPFTHTLSAGGSSTFAGGDPSCSGFFAKPVQGMAIDFSGGNLGIFVSSTVDTTLAVIDGNGEIYCNSSHELLPGNSPGLQLRPSAGGKITILVGTVDQADAGSEATVVFTEYSPATWPTLNLGSSVNTLATARIDFGDDTGQYANDGECDDPRFEGSGMALLLNDEDVRRDATDCRSLFVAGSIRLINNQAIPLPTLSTGNVDFGDNSSIWADDGQCDDPRFEGDGMALTTIEADRLSDANDCRQLFEQGLIQLTTQSGNSTGNAPISSSAGIDFGDDSSAWANDNECDDPRFTGDGMASLALDDDIRRDATDCQKLFESGSIRLASQSDAQQSADPYSINFGDNSSTWANDGECDDPRFEGDGMAMTTVEADRLSDANDCRQLFEQGLIRLIY